MGGQRLGSRREDTAAEPEGDQQLQGDKVGGRRAQEVRARPPRGDGQASREPVPTVGLLAHPLFDNGGCLISISQKAPPVVLVGLLRAY